MARPRSSALGSLAKVGPAVAEGENALVRGEADDVLASLCAAGVQARLFLIDPPYNRRTKFHHYSDSQRRDVWLEDRSRQARVMRDLLNEDGSLWMHIDDSEFATSRAMLDGIFGPSNFIATIVWQKTVSRDNRTPVSTTHEYVLAYAKNKTIWHRSRNKMPATTEQLQRYSNPDDDPRGRWTSGDLTAKAGPGRRQEQFYDLVTPSGRVVRPAHGTAWRYTRERLQELIEDGRIDFGGGNKMPRLKRFLNEVDPGLVPDTWWSGEQVGTADSAKRHLKSIFPELVPFETPKPEPLAARIIAIATDVGDLVVDVYAGSGTTASVAHKMDRRWVAVERQSVTFQDFTRPRLELVVKGLDPGGVTLQSGWLGGGSFTVLGD